MTGVESIAVITSPAFRPALDGGRVGGDGADLRAGSVRRVADVDADVRVLHLVAGDDRVGDALHRVDRDREADAVAAAAAALDLRVDADDVTGSWSSSGPPELPWLIGASVWIELAIE